MSAFDPTLLNDSQGLLPVRVKLCALVGFVAAAVSMPMGGCRARKPVASLPVVVVVVIIAVRLAVL